MIGLITPLAGEIIFEASKFIITIGLLVLAVLIGGKLRKHSDAKKAAEAESQKLSENDNITE